MRNKKNWNLARLRELHGFSEREMAEKLKISPEQYARYENGKIALTIDILIKIADVLHTNTDYILGRTEIVISDFDKFNEIFKSLKKSNEYSSEIVMQKFEKLCTSITRDTYKTLIKSNAYKQILSLRFKNMKISIDELSSRTGFSTRLLEHYLFENQKYESIKTEVLTIIVMAMNDSLDGIIYHKKALRNSFNKIKAISIVNNYRCLNETSKNILEHFISFILKSDIKNFKVKPPTHINNNEATTLSKRLIELRNNYVCTKEDIDNGISKMTQSNLSAKSMCSLKAIQNYENESYAGDVSVGYLILLANAFNVSLEYLIKPLPIVPMYDFNYYCGAYTQLSDKRMALLNLFNKFMKEWGSPKMNINDVKLQFQSNFHLAFEEAKRNGVIKDEADLAKKASLHKKTIQKYQKGESCPRLKDAIKLSNALGVTLDYLFMNSNPDIESDELYLQLKEHFSYDDNDKLSYINAFTEFLLSIQKQESEEMDGFYCEYECDY